MFFIIYSTFSLLFQPLNHFTMKPNSMNKQKTWFQDDYKENVEIDISN